MPTKQLQDWTKIKACRHPEHRPPGAMVFKPGSYEHRCPACGARSYFTVPLITCMSKALCVMALLLCSCTDETNSRRALENEGYTDIHFTGYAAFSCSDDDTYKTGFTAFNPKTNKVVSGSVCCGILKGCTIRY